MNCHIVPRVYLSSWKIQGYKNSIYVFEKNNVSKNGVQTNLKKMKNTDFAMDDVYLLKIGSNYYYSQLSCELKPLYDCTNGLYISYNEKTISTFEDFILHFGDFMSWSIFDASNNKIEPKSLFEKMENIWKSNVEDIIEDFFDRSLENHWNIYLEYIESKFSKKIGWKIDAKHKGFLIEFLVVQFCRKFENLNLYGIDVALNVFNSLMKELGIVDPLARFEDINRYKRDLWLIQIYKYIKYKESKDNRFLNNTITMLIDEFSKKLQIFLLRSPNDIDFITSDNPCFMTSDECKFLKYFGGIYFPINKKTCAFLRRPVNLNNINKYLVLDVSRTNVKYINTIIVQNSTRNIAYSKKSITDVICTNPNIKEWIEMFNAIELTFTDD